MEPTWNLRRSIQKELEKQPILDNSSSQVRRYMRQKKIKFWDFFDIFKVYKIIFWPTIVTVWVESTRSGEKEARFAICRIWPFKSPQNHQVTLKLILHSFVIGFKNFNSSFTIEFMSKNLSRRIRGLAICNLRIRRPYTRLCMKWTRVYAVWN